MVKDAKKKKADKKLRATQKTEKKGAKKDKKHSKKANNADDSDADDADLDAILAEYEKQQEQFLKVIETTCDPPSQRSSSTLVGSPSNTNELFLFGGEYYDGALASFYNDLFVYKTNTDTWRQVTSPNSPLPRSGHAMCQGDNTGGIYLFGGEFSSPKQGTFYHYNDFWRLEPASREWTKLEGKGGPPGRSGHRMTYHKNYIILFGGFQDTSQTTKYLQDVWLYDTQRFVWYSPPLPPASQKPDARSSFSFMPHEAGAVLFGGYSRVKANTATSRNVKGGKGGPSTSRVVLKPMVHQDSWLLRITPPAVDAPMNTAPTVRWERRKKPTNAPNPARAGATMAYHKGRGIMFGGVHDVEDSEEGIDSEFFNQLFAWNVDRNRFFALGLRRPRTNPKKVASTNEQQRTRRARGKADEAELLANLALLEGKEATPNTSMPDLQGAEDSDAEEAKVEKPVIWELPHARFNAQLAVQGDLLYIFGGTLENGDRETTFDEMWSIDLGKLNGVREIFRRELEAWHGSDSEDSDEDEEDEESDSEEDVSDLPDPSTPATSVATTESLDVPEALNANAETDEIEETAAREADPRPQPRPFESLREFFGRTSNFWQDAVLEAAKYQREVSHRSVKDIRKLAFDLADQRWWDLREEIQALEDEQEAAGISEVVNLAERGGENASAGRRR